MIQINPLKSYIDGGVRAALTTPPSASLVFDLPGKAIWVKGVKLKGTDHTYIFNHDNYITLTNTPDKNNPESEDIKIGVNITTLKNTIDTTYNGGTLALLQEGVNTEERTWQAKILHNYINNILPVTKNLQINGTDYAIYTTENSLPQFFAPTSLGTTGQILACTSSGLSWINQIQNTDYRVSQSSATNNSDYRIILKQEADNNAETNFVRFSEYLTFNPSTKTLKINNIKVVTATDIYVGATSTANATAGLVPAATSAQYTYFLRGDGTWVNIATEMAAANTWRPIKVENTDALGSGTDTGTLSFTAGTGITLAWDSTNKRIIITNSSPDVNHNTDENVRQVPKTDNINRPLMMINGSTSAGEQINTSMFSTGIYANASTKMITANGFIKVGSSDSYVLLGGGGHKALSDFAMASNYVKKTGDIMTGLLTTTSSNHGGIKIGNTYITAINGDLIFQNNSAIRFGGDSWDYNVWAGLKYIHSSKTIYLGLADNSAFTANNAQSGGKLYLPGIVNIYTGNGTNLIWHAGNDGSGSGLDADTCDGLHVHSGRNNEANKIIRTDANGYIQAGWINTTSGDMGTTAATRVYCSNDAYIRYKTISNFRTDLVSGLYWANIKVSTTSNTTTNPIFNITKTKCINIYGKEVTDYTKGLYFLASDNSFRARLYYNGNVRDGLLGLESRFSDISIMPPSSKCVGIGITSPSYKLHVNGTLGVSSSITAASLFINTGDSTLKVYDGRMTNAVSDGNICLQTSIDGTDGQSHVYPTQQGGRCNLVLQPRGGQVYIGTNPDGGNKAYKLYVNGNIYGNGFIKSDSSNSYVLLGGGGHKVLSEFSMAHTHPYLPLTGGTMTLGKGLKFHADDNYFGTYSDARIISLLDDNGTTCDGGLIIDERATYNGTEYITELLRIRDSEFKWKGQNILHSGNYNYYTPTLTGTGASGTWNINISGNADTIDGQHLMTQVSNWNTNSLSIFKSSENSTSNAPTTDYIYGITLRFHRDSDTYYTDLVTSLYHDRLFFRRKEDKGYMTWRELIHSGNISSQSVNYSNSAGNADTVDGYHASAFAAASHTHSQYLTQHQSLSNRLYTFQTSQEQNSDPYTWIRNEALNSLRGHCYNTSGLEWQYLWGISSGKSYGNIIRATYGDGNPYIQIMGLYGGNWTTWRTVCVLDGSNNLTISGSYYSNSDIRYKSIQSQLLNKVNLIAELPIFTYYWKDNQHDDKLHIGSSAQAVKEVFPELVTYDESKDFYNLDYTTLGTIAGITACKELVTQKSELQKLKEKVKQLEDKLRKYENTL